MGGIRPQFPPWQKIAFCFFSQEGMALPGREPLACGLWSPPPVAGSGQHHCWCHTTGHSRFSGHQAAPEPGSSLLGSGPSTPEHTHTHGPGGQGRWELPAQPRHLPSLREQHFPLIKRKHAPVSWPRQSQPRAMAGRRAGAGDLPCPPTAPRQVAPGRAGSAVLTSIFAQRPAQRVSGSTDAWAKKAYFKLAGKRTLFGGN